MHYNYFFFVEIVGRLKEMTVPSCGYNLKFPCIQIMINFVIGFYLINNNYFINVNNNKFTTVVIVNGYLMDS